MLCLLLHLQTPIFIFFLKVAFFLEGLFFFFKKSLQILIRFYKFVFIPTALFTVHISLSLNSQYRKCFSSSDLIHSASNVFLLFILDVFPFLTFSLNVLKFLNVVLTCSLVLKLTKSIQTAGRGARN